MSKTPEVHRVRQGLEKKEFTITDCPVRGACFVMCDLLAGDMSLLEDLVKHMPHEEQEAVAWEGDFGQTFTDQFKNESAPRPGHLVSKEQINLKRNIDAPDP